MAFGTHWEWRAFGVPPLKLFLFAIESLDKAFCPNDQGREHVDDYLWYPDCRVNIKLRAGTLKFKRLLKTADGGCELWTEAAQETFAFPLEPQAFSFMMQHMGVKMPPHREAWGASQAAFRQALASFNPPLHLIAVRKHRIQYNLTIDGEPLHLELAEIIAPHPTWSIALEGKDLGEWDDALKHPHLEASQARLAKAREMLELPGRMQVTGYLQMLKVWKGCVSILLR